MNEETGEMQNYQKLSKQDSTREIWALSIFKELGTLSQGCKVVVKGTDTLFLMSHDEIRDITPDKTVTYAQIVVDYRPQKANPNHVRLTVGVISSMSQETSSLQQQTLKHLRYSGIVCFQQNMRGFHALISRICISKLQ